MGRHSPALSRKTLSNPTAPAGVGRGPPGPPSPRLTHFYTQHLRGHLHPSSVPNSRHRSSPRPLWSSFSQTSCPNQRLICPRPAPPTTCLLGTGKSALHVRTSESFPAAALSPPTKPTDSTLTSTQTHLPLISTLPPSGTDPQNSIAPQFTNPGEPVEINCSTFATAIGEEETLLESDELSRAQTELP